MRGNLGPVPRAHMSRHFLPILAILSQPLDKPLMLGFRPLACALLVAALVQVLVSLALGLHLSLSLELGHLLVFFFYL